MNDLLKTVLEPCQFNSFSDRRVAITTLLRSMAEYQRGRDVRSETVLLSGDRVRRAYIWTMSDGERLLALTNQGALVYWQPSRSPEAILKLAVGEWLTPSVSTSRVH